MCEFPITCFVVSLFNVALTSLKRENSKAMLVLNEIGKVPSKSTALFSTRLVILKNWQNKQVWIFIIDDTGLYHKLYCEK